MTIKTDLREAFLSYFEERGHKRVPSSSLIPHGDPTLFFTNAGMVQFKDVFLGHDTRPYKRATSSQKCMRVSGKHNDLENVGYTQRHHTFFEMLGNFSFGDYFKEEAIAFAWEFLTKVIDISKELLYVTIYKDDDEAEEIWLKHVPRSRIFRFGEEDNFWSMGDTGPCGPCSEILIDREPSGKKMSKEILASERCMELWNLVFMQFNRREDGTMEKLDRPCIDTGMGLERLAAVLENTQGNYETSLFMPIIRKIEELSQRKYLSRYKEPPITDVAMRVIADHVRAMTFLVADGVLPSNEGRGYVLRRIIRRAARFGRMLGIKPPFFGALADTVIEMMGGVYPEIVAQRESINGAITAEELKFSETLDKGMELLTEKFDEMRKGGIKCLSGEDVFRLYDTYGFPKDLTRDIAAEAGFSIDGEGFERMMEEQRMRARSAWKGSCDGGTSKLFLEMGGGVATEFVGYTAMQSEGKVLLILKDGCETDFATEGDKISFVVDRTPFYGASGGQVGDSGLVLGDGLEIVVEDTTRPSPSIFLHIGVVKSGKISVGDRVRLEVDEERRRSIMRNHTATHILHKALRTVLGEHVRQAGSLVEADRLRFDFAHFKALAPEEILQVEDIANSCVLRNLEVEVKELPYAEAIKKGALAFFGDKYGEVVRTVSVGDFSMELCGGTHVRRSGDIGMIKIVKEESVSAGVRRIEAVTGTGALRYLQDLESKLGEIGSRLGVSRSDVVSRVLKLLSDVKRLEKELQSAKRGALGDAGREEGFMVSGVSVLARFDKGIGASEMRHLSDVMRSKVKSGVVFIASESSGKTSILLAVTKDLTYRFKARELITKLLSSIGGSGGGGDEMAQGGIGRAVGQDELKDALIRAIGGE